MGRKNKILKLGWPAERMVIGLDAEGESLRSIAEQVGERFDEDVSHESVKNYLNEHVNDDLARMTEENRGYLAQEKREMIMDYKDTIEDMNDKLDTIMNETLSEHDKNDIGQLLQVMKEQRKTMKFIREHLENATSPDTEINNYEITNNTAIQLSEKLQEYEKQGIIEIKKPHKLSK